MTYLTLIFPVVTVLLLLLYFIYYFCVARPRRGTTEWITEKDERKPLSFLSERHPMTKKDRLPIILITVIYAVVAFLGLGDTSTPESFHRFTSEDKSVTITLDEQSEISTIMYYTGLWQGHYKIEFSEDGESWTEQVIETAEGEDPKYAMNQPWSDLFQWEYVTFNEETPTIKAIRISSSRTPMELGEVVIYDASGGVVSALSCTAPELFDEQELVPERPSYLNGTYFDEIYHARTAYEYVIGETIYETSHPPLGKLIITIGIYLFGMVPFGWRFMGVLFGIAMVPVMYIFLKNLFGKTNVAVCGTLLFSFDFMHFVQTRIATIDTYPVFFIILMYFFMYRYVTTPYDTPLRKKLLPLFLSGLMFGIGIATKWVAVYAGIGLAVIYAIHHVKYYLYRRRNKLIAGYASELIITLLLSVLFFIVIPLMIYIASYIPNGYIKGMSISGGMLTNKDFYKMIWDNQVFMFTYHSGLEATHSYQSSWYQWIFNIRPILYYLDYMDGNMKSAFAAFGNPVVWWGGLMAIFAMFYQTIAKRDGKALFILIGYFSQLAPWFLISRCTFVYHYFPSTIFLVLAIAHTFDTIMTRKRGHYRLAVYGFTGGALALFAAFYPVLTGIPTSRTYTTKFLRWFRSSWPF